MPENEPKKTESGVNRTESEKLNDCESVSDNDGWTERRMSGESETESATAAAVDTPFPGGLPWPRSPADLAASRATEAKCSTVN